MPVYIRSKLNCTLASTISSTCSAINATKGDKSTLPTSGMMRRSGRSTGSDSRAKMGATGACGCTQDNMAWMSKMPIK